MVNRISTILFYRRQGRWDICRVEYLRNRQYHPPKDPQPTVANYVYIERRPRKYNVGSDYKTQETVVFASQSWKWQAPYQFSRWG